MLIVRFIINSHLTQQEIMTHKTANKKYTKFYYKQDQIITVGNFWHGSKRTRNYQCGIIR